MRDFSLGLHYPYSLRIQARNDCKIAKAKLTLQDSHNLKNKIYGKDISWRMGNAV